MKILRYVISEDCGQMINPNVVEGQIAGGTVQGIGGALLEHFVYDDDRVRRCGIGLIGLGSTPVRAVDAEAAVIGRPVSEVSADELGQLATANLDHVPDDLNGTASYRRRVGASMVARAWERASHDATGADNG